MKRMGGRMIIGVEARWLGAFVLATLGTACGNRAEPSANVAAVSEVATTSIPPATSPLTSPSSAPTTPSPTEVVATTPPNTDPGATALDSPLGRVSYVLPAQSWADPRDVGQLDDVTVAHAWWIVPDCCYLKLTLQDFAPPRPDDERVGQFESNGLAWDLYDIGPRDRSTMVAAATVNGLTVSVSAQGQSGVSTQPSPSQIAESVARSVVVT